MKNNLTKIVRKKSGRIMFWGFWFLPKAKREALYTIFAFMHHLEDVTESDMDLEDKKDIINLWRSELDNIYDKKVPATDIGRKIYKNCMRFKLPKEEFEKLIDAISQDVFSSFWAPSMQQFDDYCRGVSGVAGNLSLRILGCDDKELLQTLSFNLGRALQITNILRNIKEDIGKNRLYIPIEILQKAGIESLDSKSVLVNKNLYVARQELAMMAFNSYKQVYLVLGSLDKDIAKPLKLITDIYKMYFDVMEKRGWEVVSPKPSVSKLKKIILLTKSFVC